MPHSPEPSERYYHIGLHQFTAERPTPGLYLTATPIGNLGDITLRALNLLAACDVLLCEDTRTTGHLLTRFGIKQRLMAYHEHNAEKMGPRILADLAAGMVVGLVSDAGMPLVSDPGFRLVEACIAAGHPITTLPGPSAVISALALSGLPTDHFSFIGFLPAKSGERERVLQHYSSLSSTLIAFETPHRILDSLQDIERLFPQRLLALTRELTKLHEEVIRGTACDIAAQLKNRPSIKGEITLVMAPHESQVTTSTDELDQLIDQALSLMPASQAAAELAQNLQLPRKMIYARILARKA